MGIYTERFKLIRIVQNKATELQRVPKRKDFDPSAAYRLTKFFGSFGDAILASGLKPNRTFITYDMMKGKQIEDFTLAEETRKELNEKELTIKL